MQRSSRSSRRSPIHGSFVLLIDDHPRTLEFWQSVLDEQGAHVMGAPSIADALEIIRKSGGRIDAVVLDFLFQDGDASEVVRALARSCCAPGLVLATGIPPELARAQARRFRADRLVLKPVDATELVASVAGALAARDAREASATGSIVGEPADARSVEAWVDAAIDRLARDMLRRAGLTNARREVALWNRILGRDDADTAQELGIAKNSVRSMIKRACHDIGADDSRDLPRILIRQVGEAVLEVVLHEQAGAHGLVSPVLDALARLPPAALLRVRASASRPPAAIEASACPPSARVEPSDTAIPAATA